MYLSIDSLTEVVTLEEADDCGSFSVDFDGEGGAAAAAEILAENGSGRACDADHVWVAIGAVQALAGTARPPVDADWAARFATMVDYAASKGWVDAAGTHLRAHLS